MLFLRVGIVAVLFVLLAAGCSSSSRPDADKGTETTTVKEVDQDDSATSQDEAKSLDVKKSGFTQGRFGISAGALIYNPYDEPVELAEIESTLTDADGEIVGSGSQTLAQIPPKTEVAFRLNISTNKEGVEGAKLEVKAAAISFARRGRFFTTENVKLNPFGDFPEVTGSIVSPFEKDLSMIKVEAVYLDKDGNVIGSGFSLLDTIPGGGKAAFQISPGVNLKDAKDVRVFAHL